MRLATNWLQTGYKLQKTDHRKTSQLIGRGGVRTRTSLSRHRILSPMRLPVSPLGQECVFKSDGQWVELLLGRAGCCQTVEFVALSQARRVTK